ncbi:MAG: methylmalonyl Co-A mutase-associated GTPase MeaB [Betaproteobacteria bacterium]|nr:methylmalonyl Co-A mutase-associated GTPase MeaB [Betaproteobacteria bacterium]
MEALDIRRTARAISAVENHAGGAGEIVRKAYRAARYVPVVGVTGPPGAGKSTLVDRLAVHWADRGEKVAVLAVDPTSPFTGGAVLGDRFRMERATGHPLVFVRSLASRGQLGGLSGTATDIVMVLGDLGFDRVLLETVGAGQTDVAVGMVADAVMVVTVPGLGDHIQAAKAGILEIGDLYAVNKSDLAGATAVAGHLEANLDLVYPGSAGRNAPHGSGTPQYGNPTLRRRHGDATDALGFWRPPVLMARAREGGGIDALADATEDFLAWSRETARYDDRVAERLRFQILRATQGRLMELCLAADGEGDVDLVSLAGEIASGAVSPDEAAERLIEQWVRRASNRDA